MAPRLCADKFPPLNLGRDRSSVIQDVKQRLDALFEKYGVDPTPEGWRELALRLAVEHEKATKVNPKFTKRLPNLGELLSMRRLLGQNPKLSQAEAAKK